MVNSRVNNFDLVGMVSTAVPWGASYIPAYLAYHNVRSKLEFDPISSFLVAGVVEGLGIASIHTAVELINKKRNGEAISSWDIGLAIGSAIFYLSVVISVNILLDIGASWEIVTARALMSTVNIPAAIIISIRSIYRKQEETSNMKSDVQSLRGRLGAAQRTANRWQQEAEAAQRTANRWQQEAEAARGSAEAAQSGAEAAQKRANRWQQEAEAARPVGKAWNKLAKRYQLAAMVAAGLATKDEALGKLDISRRTLETDMAKISDG